MQCHVNYYVRVTIRYEVIERKTNERLLSVSEMK